MHADLLRLRREHAPVPLGAVDGAMLGPEAFVAPVLRPRAGDRLLVVNLGPDLRLDPPPSRCWPRPRTGSGWALLWSSEDPRYGGGGVPPMAFEGNDAWRIPGHSATVLEPRRSGSLNRDETARPGRCPGDPPRRRSRPASGSSPTAWAATPRGPSPGYATRRYHGLLIAALPSPLGRTMMLNHCVERLTCPTARRPRSASSTRPAGPLGAGAGHLAEFRLEAGLPVWRYEVGGVALEKRLVAVAPPEHDPRHLPPGRGRRARRR